MQLLDIYPYKGSFKPGEIIKFVVCLQTEHEIKARLRFTIYYLAEIVEVFYRYVKLSSGSPALQIEWGIPSEVPSGYGVTAELLDDSGETISIAETAFDIQQAWTDFPRYGFVSDFSLGREDISSAIDILTRFHINGLQFYDWLYRHDHLLPPNVNYLDPLGRNQSLDTVNRLISEAHQRGMAVMPYMAIYAASLPFWQAHLKWALYDSAGKPYQFEGFLGLMDPSPESSWIKHIRSQCTFVLENLPFDGIHVDQYGEPKEGWTFSGSPVDIPLAFSTFIKTLKKEHPSKSVVFNAVGNWPIEALATAPQDFVYIEVWPPDESYKDLTRIIANARNISGNKPVVIALYLPNLHEENIRLADALIFSLGGSRIELGEDGRLLSDPYFPKHQAVSLTLKKSLRRYYDFAVRYSDLIGPSAEAKDDLKVAAPPGIWTVARQTLGWVVICLINFTGLDDPCWNEQLNTPNSVYDFSLDLIAESRVLSVWWASPDGPDSHMASISWQRTPSSLRINIPALHYWGFVALELKTK